MFVVRGTRSMLNGVCGGLAEVEAGNVGSSTRTLLQFRMSDSSLCCVSLVRL